MSDRGKKTLYFVSFIYPSLLYYIFLLWSWFSWSRIPSEVNVYATILIIIIAEYVFFYIFSDKKSGGLRFLSLFVNLFLLLFPLIFLVIFIQHRYFLWVRWYLAFFYINHAVFLDWGFFGLFLLAIGSILIAVLCYRFVARRPKVIFGFYLPWAVFMLPLFLKYFMGGVLLGDIKQYKFIEPYVNLVEKVAKETNQTYRVFTPPRGLYIENDKLFAVYGLTLLTSFADKTLFVHDMKTQETLPVELPGKAVRRIFSRPTDPYLYIVIWKINPGFFRLNKSEPEKLECLLDLERGALVAKSAEILYQIGNTYVDRASRAAYLVSDPYPVVGKFWLDSKIVNILDLYEQGFCPKGSILGFMPSVDNDERYMYLSVTNCYCGVVKIDMQRLEVVGCYEIEDSRKGFYGPTFYKNGQVITFPVVKNFRTVVLDAESMQSVKEYEKPPFNYIRDIIELDSENLLCLGFFGDLAIFNIKTGKYKTVIRKDLSMSMGIYKYGDYVYINTARYGIVRIKVDYLLSLAKAK